MPINSRHRSLSGPVPRANNLTILGHEYVEKTIGLLHHFGQLPISVLADFWYYRYDECIDFTNIGCRGGIKEFLENNMHLFELNDVNDGKSLVVSLVSPTTWNSSKAPINRDIARRDSGYDTSSRGQSEDGDWLFCKENHLWTSATSRQILNKKNLRICRSAYEAALAVNEEKTRNMVNRIRRVLRSFPHGLELTQLYLHLDTSQFLKTFNVSTSIVSLVDELPEIFYRQENQIFDGFTTTITDLTGHEASLYYEGAKPERIVECAIERDVYQMTLMLIKEGGPKDGLKINVWMRSLRENFFNKDHNGLERKLRGFNTLTYFLALARCGLVELTSHQLCRNDIRAHLPTKNINATDLNIMLNLNSIGFPNDGQCHYQTMRKAK